MAMNSLESASCVRFKPILIKPSGNITWIHFTNPQRERNCVHKPEYKERGEVVFVLGFDCLKDREIMHSLLHAIGFKDEVTHPYRDNFVRVLWNNIQPEYRHLYQIQSHNHISSKLLVEYDPLSVMHFHDRAYSMNGHATVMPLVPGLLISPSEDLSQLDKLRLRLYFDHECNKRNVGFMVDKCKMMLGPKIKFNEELNNCNQTKPIENVDLSNDVKPDEEVDSKVENGEVGSKVEDGEVDSKVEDGEVDSKVEDGEVDSKVEDGEVDSKVEDGEVDSKVEDGGVNSNVKDDEVDSKVEDGGLDSKVEHNEKIHTEELEKESQNNGSNDENND